jgi:hypothetical protein
MMMMMMMMLTMKLLLGWTKYAWVGSGRNQHHENDWMRMFYDCATGEAAVRVMLTTMRIKMMMTVAAEVGTARSSNQTMMIMMMMMKMMMTMMRIRKNDLDHHDCWTVDHQTQAG